MDKLNIEEIFRSGGKKGVDTLQRLADASEIGGRLVLSAAFGNAAEKVLGVEAWADALGAEGAETAGEGTAEKSSGGGSIPDRELAKLFRSVGTAVWKLEGRMVDAETGEAKEEYRRVWRHVEAIKDALEGIGVETIDWTGKRYDEGMSLKVVSEEERPGMKAAEIVETLLPTIRFRKAIQLQQGEVVVGRPFREEKNEPLKVNGGDGGNE